MGIGSFFKGEKKKKKKGSGGAVLSSAPVFTPPDVAVKGKAKY